MNFSQFSSIQEETIVNNRQEPDWTSGKVCPQTSTDQGSHSREKNKESPIIRNFFKSNKTESDLDSSKQHFTYTTNRNKDLTLQSSVLSYSYSQ